MLADRLLQLDPKQFGAGHYNLYRYCHNDPVNRTDPTGLINWGQVGQGVVSVIGGIGATAATIALAPTGVGTWLAPVAAVEAAAAYSYGIGNIVAGFADNPSNHETTGAMLNSPQNVGGAVGRAAGAIAGDADGGQQKQTIGSLIDNVGQLGAGIIAPPSTLNPSVVLPAFRWSSFGWHGCGSKKIASTMARCLDRCLLSPPCA
jgi:hypothetical protein